MIRPVQLIPEAEAVPGRISYGTPAYDAVECQDCPAARMCEERNGAFAFDVKAVRGNRFDCKRIGRSLVMCETRHRPDQEAGVVRRKSVRRRRWLIDANIFRAAWNKGSPQRKFLDRPDVAACTTPEVEAELPLEAFRPPGLEIVTAPELDVVIKMADFAIDDLGKKPSRADRSLVDALIHFGDIVGIVSDDGDIRRMDPPSWIRKTQARETQVVRLGAVTP